jgi:hypothetical protein
MSGRNETGAVLLLALLGCLVLFLFAGLVYDGGRVLVARRDGVGVAAEAARAGAQALATPTLSGPVALDSDKAVAAAEAQLARSGWSGSAQVDGSTVTVTANKEVAMTFWRMLGWGQIDAQAKATAQAVAGVKGQGQ